MQGCAKPTSGDFPFFALYKAWQSFNQDFDQNLGNRHLETHLALNIPHSEKSLWSLRNEIRCLFDLPSTYNSQIAGKPTTQRLLISADQNDGQRRENHVQLSVNFQFWHFLSYSPFVVFLYPRNDYNSTKPAIYFFWKTCEFISMKMWLYSLWNLKNR